MVPFRNSHRQARGGVPRHVAEDGPNIASRMQAARGLRLIEACHESHRSRHWVEPPELKG